MLWKSSLTLAKQWKGSSLNSPDTFQLAIISSCLWDLQANHQNKPWEWKSMGIPGCLLSFLQVLQKGEKEKWTCYFHQGNLKSLPKTIRNTLWNRNYVQQNEERSWCLEVLHESCRVRLERWEYVQSSCVLFVGGKQEGRGPQTLRELFKNRL